MDTVIIGKIVDTHGIKGEIRILSDFPYKDRVFQVGNTLWIDEKEYTIESYRVHKNYDMVTFQGYSNINEVLFLIHKKVFFDKDLLHLAVGEVLDEDLLTYEVLTEDGQRGTVQEVFMASESNKILRIQLNREVLIPMNSPMIEKIDTEHKQLIIHLMDGI